MTTGPVDLAEFRLLRALRASPGGAPFTQLWNAQAGAVWSVFRAMVDRDAEALGWMSSFRLDLQERVATFRVDEAVGPQMGRALYGHAATAFPEAGPLPTHPIPPDEVGVRQLPPATRLAYLVDLFFDWSPPDPQVGAAHRLMEPDDDTDARLLVYTALLRNPPGDAKILPPGTLPDEPRARRTPAGAFTLGLLMAVVLGAWAFTQLPTPGKQGATALPAGLTLDDADPDRLARRLEVAGVPGGLARVPDLLGAGLTLRSARLDPDAVILTYTSPTATWWLRHAAPRGGDGALHLETEAQTSRATWEDAAGAWTLAANVAPDEVLAVARAALGRTAPNAVPSAPP